MSVSHSFEGFAREWEWTRLLGPEGEGLLQGLEQDNEREQFHHRIYLP